MEKRIISRKSSQFIRLCSMILAIVIFCTTASFSLSESKYETYLSLYFADATMAEGANSEKTERLFRTSGALSTFETVQA